MAHNQGRIRLTPSVGEDFPRVQKRLLSQFFANIHPAGSAKGNRTDQRLILFDDFFKRRGVPSIEALSSFISSAMFGLLMITFIQLCYERNAMDADVSKI